MGLKLRVFILRHAGWVMLIGLISSIVMGYFTSQLFSNLRTDLEELLPTDARSVLDLGNIRSRLESTNNLEIISISQNPSASKKWVDDLANELNHLPKDVVSSVEYKIDNELHFFLSRSSLFLELNDLKTIKTYIKNKLNYESQLYNPMTFLENLDLREPRLDFNLFQKKYTSKTSAYSHFPNGYYASPDERVRIVIANLPANSGGISAAKKMHQAVDSIILKLDPKKYSQDLEVHFSGGVQDLIEEHDAIVADLVFSTIIVCVLVGLAMLIFFRSFIATFALVSSLIIGTLWTFGIGFFEIGYLNSNTAFMASIVIGNGINFGIILLARFMEEKQKNMKSSRALLISLKKTFPATVIAASAAGLSYGSLMLTSFRGFRQFGFLGFVGMIFCWISAYTILPAILIGLHRLGFFKKNTKRKVGRFSFVLATFVEKSSKPILAFTAMLSIFSLLMLPKVNSSIIETDLRKLRNRDSLESGSIYWSKFVDEVFQHYLSPLIILPHKDEHVLPIQNELRAYQMKYGDLSYIANVNTIQDFVPADQNKKILVLQEINEILKPDIRFKLDKKDRTMITDLLSKDSLHPFTSQDLPELIKSKFREKDGTLGRLILVEPTLSDELTKSQTLIQFVHSIRETADQIEPGVPIAGSFSVTSDMFESILKDGPKTTLLAFMAVFLMIIILFRDLKMILLCAFTLIIGVLWLIGIAIAMHEKINFLNFIALPITFGIGVDYGINIFQRYRLERRLGILSVIKNTGGAVILVSLTTVIGYASLIIAKNQAFVSFGTLAILGEFCCVIVAVISLPALLYFLSSERKLKHGIPDFKKA